jgi:hypothetical protein
MQREQLLILLLQKQSEVAISRQFIKANRIFSVSRVASALNSADKMLETRLNQNQLKEILHTNKV